MIFNFQGQAKQETHKKNYFRNCVCAQAETSTQATFPKSTIHAHIKTQSVGKPDSFRQLIFDTSLQPFRSYIIHKISIFEPPPSIHPHPF